MRSQFLTIMPLLLTPLACDGYLATTGRLVSSGGQPLSGCAARIETAEGVVVRDWEAVDSQLSVGEVVAPGRDTYLLLLNCPGYYPELLRVRSGMPPGALGEISFAPLVESGGP